MAAARKREPREFRRQDNHLRIAAFRTRSWSPAGTNLGPKFLHERRDRRRTGSGASQNYEGAWRVKLARLLSLFRYARITAPNQAPGVYFVHQRSWGPSLEPVPPRSRGTWNRWYGSQVQTAPDIKGRTLGPRNTACASKKSANVHGLWDQAGPVRPLCPPYNAGTCPWTRRTFAACPVRNIA